MVRVEPKHNFLGIIFSQNLMHCLTNQLNNRDRFLFRAAEKSVKAIQDTVQTNPDTIIPILLNLTGNGTYNFDQATKTKTVDKLLSQTHGSLAGNAVQILRKPALEIKQ
jgi:DNA polymerase phi